MKLNLTALAIAGLTAGVCQANEIIPIETDNTALVYTVSDDGRLYQSYFGKKLSDSSEYASLPQSKKEAYLTHGMEDYFEPPR